MKQAGESRKERKMLLQELYMIPEKITYKTKTT